MGMKGATLSGVATKASESLVRNLSRLGDVSARKMFGGYGVFESSTMFALVLSAEEERKRKRQSRRWMPMVGIKP